MRTLLAAICCTLFHWNILAQKEIVVLHISGQPTYFARHGAPAQLLRPGMELDLSGKIQCKGSSNAKLLYNGQSVLVSGSKVRDLKDVLAAASSSGQAGFTSRFVSFVTESVKDGDNSEKLKKHHRRYMSKTSGGIKGYAKPNFAIMPVLTSSGVLPSAKVIFKWRHFSGKGPYAFQLFDAAQKPVAQLLVRDTFVTLDLDELDLSLEEEYEWTVSKNNQNDRSASVPFKVDSKTIEDAQASLAKLADYQAASPVEQRLMCAFQLEESKCYYSANEIYGQLLVNQPDNWLLRKLYATFLARMDMLPEADKILSETKN